MSRAQQETPRTPTPAISPLARTRDGLPIDFDNFQILEPSTALRSNRRAGYE